MRIWSEKFDQHFITSKRKSSDHLMLVLHGRGDSLDPFKKFQDELKLYDFNFLLLNAPRKFEDGFSWYGEPPYLKEGVLRMRQRISRVIFELEERGWASENIYLLGFSQGALVVSDVALHYPRPLGGVVGVSGYFHFFPQWRRRMSVAARKTPWLFTHGHQDDILDIEDTRFGVKQLQRAGLEVEWIELDKAHDFDDRELPMIKRWISRTKCRPRSHR